MPVLPTARSGSGGEGADDDDNLIVFPPMADDKSHIFIYSVHVQS